MLQTSSLQRGVPYHIPHTTYHTSFKTHSVVFKTRNINIIIFINFLIIKNNKNVISRHIYVRYVDVNN
jgi:hypothetical protein